MVVTVSRATVREHSKVALLTVVSRATLVIQRVGPSALVPRD